MRKTSLDRQKGVALIFVLFIFAIITTIASSIMVKNYRNTERSAYYLHYQQAKHYAMAGEQYISTLLFNMSQQNNNNKNTWFQPWAENHIIEVPGGKIQIQMIDEQALVNLNLLHGKNGKKYEPVFRRLFERLNIDPSLVERIQHWGSDKPEILDEQDSIYMAALPPYRAGGTNLSSVSELLLMQILNQEQYEKLRPFVTVLPEEVTVNFNTLPKELFSIIFEEITPEDAEEIDMARGKEGFSSLDDMRKHSALEGKKINWQNVSGQFYSQYFSAWIKADYGDATYYLHSLIAIDEQGNVRMLGRKNSSVPEWVPILRQSVRQH